jgi:hypothetical protein
MLKVVIAEEDPLMVEFLGDVIAEGEYRMCGLACTVDAAVEFCKHHEPDLDVCDAVVSVTALRDAIIGYPPIGTSRATRLNPSKRSSINVYEVSNSTPAR